MCYKPFFFLPKNPFYFNLTRVDKSKDSYFFNFSELDNEKDVLDLTTSEEKCVVHFFHEDFRRCAIIDTHLKVTCLILSLVKGEQLF